MKKPNGMLACVKKQHGHQDKEGIVPLYSQLVGSHLESCVQLWAPHYKKDIEKPEHVQKKAVELMKGREHNSCEVQGE